MTLLIFFSSMLKSYNLLILVEEESYKVPISSSRQFSTLDQSPDFFSWLKKYFLLCCYNFIVTDMIRVKWLGMERSQHLFHR